MERWSHPIQATSLQTLRSYLQQPLTDEEKIPISQHEFDWLCVPLKQSRGYALRAQQLSTLFRVSADECAPGASGPFIHAIGSVPPTLGTEERFHGTWDRNISEILELILGVPTIRNGNGNTSTALKQPDYGLLVKGHCVFRGEETGSVPEGDPKEELSEKIELWTYGGVPYILGLLWILLRFKRFLCIYDRISRSSHGRSLCCNYSPAFDN